MQAIIIGCGRTGAALAARLDGEGDAVCVVDVDEDARERLPSGFRGTYLVGSGTSRAVLEQADIAHAEALVALSPSDSVNIVAARIARDIFKVPRVLGRLYDPAHAAAYAELGIAAIGSVQTTVNRVHRMLHHRALEPEQTFGNGETLLVRATVPSYLQGRRADELNVPGEILVVEVTRGGHSRVPEPSTLLAGGDHVSFVVTSGSLSRLRSFLDGRWE